MTQERKPIESLGDIQYAVVHYSEIDRDEFIAIRKEHFEWLCEVVQTLIERVNNLTDNQK